MTSRLAIIGAGRVGQTLAIIFQQLGYQIETIITRSPDKQTEFSKLVNQPKFLTITTDFPNPDLLIIATPDSAIAETAGLLATRDVDWSQTIIVHCSGAFGAELLAPLKARGAQVGSLHPLKSIARPILNIDEAHREFRDVYWCVDGDDSILTIGHQLAQFLQSHIVQIDSQMKAVYHASAVMACGHLVALFDLSLAMLGECGIDREQALKMLLPLTQGTVKNLINGSENALTGPFARRDSNTINHHMQALMTLKGNYLAIYSLLGQQSLEIVNRSKEEKN